MGSIADGGRTLASALPQTVRDAHRARSFAFSLSIVVGACGTAAGAYLRFTQLSSQILIDDEWHAIHKLLHSDVKGIVTSFGVADYSIPLTLYYRLLATHGGLTEWQMHLPMLVAGIGLLVVAPLLLRRHASPPVLAAWIVLLAISPILVYLSRTARPYALTCLLVFVAIVAFRNWWREAPHARAWGAAYAIAAFLAGWLHLVTLPFTLLPFAYAGWRALASSASGERAIARLVALALATAIPLTVVLVPPLVSSRAELAAKTATDSATWESVYRTLLMMFGISSPWLLAACVVLCVVGARRFASRNADHFRYVAFVCVGAGVAIVLARPPWIQHPLVLARYLLPALPFALLLLAEGAFALAGRVAALSPAVAACAGIGLFFAGPIPAYLYWPNQFMGHQRFQFDYDPAHNPYVLEIPREPIPAFYRELAKRPPGSVTLIEAPWRLESNFDPHPWYQQVHRQFVKIGLVTPTCGVRDFGDYPASVTELRFRNFVHLSDVLAGHASGAEYLVMHVVPWKTPPDATVDWPDVEACLPKIQASLGESVYRDDRIVVFALHGRH